MRNFKYKNSQNPCATRLSSRGGGTLSRKQLSSCAAKFGFTLAEGATHVVQPKNVGKAAFTKPSRGTSDSERRTIINGNRVFRFDCERCRLTRGAAFTLAEVLITLGIIGVVSAMTLPTLVKNHQRKVYVTQLHKVYNEVQQAVDMYVTDNNYVNLGESKLRNNPTELRRFVTNYFKIAKDCETYMSNCMAEEYTSLKGDVISVKNGLCNVVVSLTDGAALCFDVAAMDDVVGDDGNTLGSEYGKYWAPEFLEIEVDINGKQGPNVHGRDVFAFSVNTNGQIVDQYYIANGNEANLDSKWYTNGTFGKIMNEGWQMNY